MTTLDISWLTPSQAARLLGLSAGRVRQLADDGRLPSTRTGYGRLFAAADVEALRKEREEHAEAHA